MGLGKNKKKYWRKCQPQLEDDVYKAQELKKIENASFEIAGKLTTKAIKYSTVPRIKVKPMKKAPLKPIGDIWKEQLPELSKRQRKIDEAMKKRDEEMRTKTADIIHPGMSWNPSKKDHESLLDLLANDELKKIKEERKFEFKYKPEIEETQKSEVKEDNDEIDEEMKKGEDVKKEKPNQKIMTTKQKKQKLRNLKMQTAQQKAHEKEKIESHELRNVDRFVKEIKRENKCQKKRRDWRENAQKEREMEKEKSQRLASMPFQMPDELAPRLSAMQMINPLNSLMSRIKSHIRPVGASQVKKKNARKLTKMFKKSGIV